MNSPFPDVRRTGQHSGLSRTCRCKDFLHLYDFEQAKQVFHSEKETRSFRQWHARLDFTAKYAWTCSKISRLVLRSIVPLQKPNHSRDCDYVLLGVFRVQSGSMQAELEPRAKRFERVRYKHRSFFRYKQRRYRVQRRNPSDDMSASCSNVYRQIVFALNRSIQKFSFRLRSAANFCYLFTKMCVHAIEKNLHYITNDLPFFLSSRKRERRAMRDMHVKKITSYRGTISRNANISNLMTKFIGTIVSN